MNTDKNKQN